MRALALLLAFLCACGPLARPSAPPVPSTSVAPTVAGTSPTVSATPPAGKGRMEKGSFRSSVLNRTLSYIVYLPPGYDANAPARYPVAYVLHGGGGDLKEWVDYGLFTQADALMGSGAISPFVIVLPEGDQEYWVDHVIDRTTGSNGEKWGTYTAREVVPTIDSRYRTIPQQDARAIGGLSMGGHGAMQLAMNFTGIWSAIVVTSPSLRAQGEAPTYLGAGAEYAARDPLSLIGSKPEVARSYAWWIDTADTDPWLVPATAIHQKLSSLAIQHEWRVPSGDHSAAYWEARVPDVLKFYSSVLCRDRANCPRR